MGTEPVMLVAMIVLLILQFLPSLVPMIPGITPEQVEMANRIIQGLVVLIGGWVARGRVSPVRA